MIEIADSLVSLYNVLQYVPNMCFSKRRKSEACPPGLQSWDDFADVVANETEAGISDILLYHCRQEQDLSHLMPKGIRANTAQH